MTIGAIPLFFDFPCVFCAFPCVYISTQSK